MLAIAKKINTINFFIRKKISTKLLSAVIPLHSLAYICQHLLQYTLDHKYNTAYHHTHKTYHTLTAHEKLRLYTHDLDIE